MMIFLFGKGNPWLEIRPTRIASGGYSKAELKKRNLTYRVLADRLTAAGNPDGGGQYCQQDQPGQFPCRLLRPMPRGHWLQENIHLPSNENYILNFDYILT